MAYGHLREKVSFQTRESVNRGGGNHVEGWVDIPTAVHQRARVKPMRGREDVIGLKLSGRNVCEIKLRNHKGLAGITADDRLVNVRTGVVYSIKNIENRDERGHYLTLMCETGRADAR